MNLHALSVLSILCVAVLVEGRYFYPSINAQTKPEELVPMPSESSSSQGQTPNRPMCKQCKPTYVSSRHRSILRKLPLRIALDAIERSLIGLLGFCTMDFRKNIFRNMKPNRFVPINNILFFKISEPCENGLQRDAVGICREVWD